MDLRRLPSQLPLHRQAVGAPSSRPDGRSSSHSTAPRLGGLGHRLGREALAFGAIGVVSTALYAVLYLALRSVTGPAVANAIALVLTAVGNTAANRRLTFGVRGRDSILRDQAVGFVALGVALAITTASVGLLGTLAPGSGRLVELAVLVVANALATVARFVLLRTLIAGDRSAAPTSVATPRPGAVAATTDRSPA
jgi:putative flippase GtrA